MPKPKNRRPITVDDLWQIERAGSVALSPDGRRAVCSVSTYSMDDNTGSTSLWLLSTEVDGGAPRRLTSCGEKDGAAAWSPRGDRIAFVAKREQQGKKDDTPQLYVIAPDGGEAQRVSDFAPGIEAFKWFPDSERIAFLAWVWPDEKGSKAQAKRHQAFQERKETAYVTSEAGYRWWDRNLPMDRVVHLLVLDVASGAVTDLFEGGPLELQRHDPDASVFDVSPDGRRIAFVHDPAAEQRADHCKALAEIDVRSGKVHRIAHDDGWDFEAPRYDAEGRRIAFLASQQGLKHTMPAQLAVVDVAAGGAKRKGGGWQLLSAEWDASATAPLRWSADGAALYVAAEDRGRKHLYRFDVATRRAEVVAPGGWLHGFDAAAGVAVVAADAMDHPARLHAWRENGAPPLRIERFNDERMAGLAMGRSESVTVTGALGEPVQMWVVYPPGFDRKQKYPLLHTIHGGPHAAAGDTFHYRWNNQLFAAQGYVVAGVNYHGSSGFGHAFLDSITHRWGELELRDLEAGTDWLLGQPWADRKRVFATGGSYGGYLVAWLNGHVPPGRYHAYVCHAGCFDWTSMFGGDAWFWHPKELGGWYWDDAEHNVRAQSPHAFAQSMRTPTLVIHGALDYRVPDAQGLAYYNTLKARGVDARLVWFPDENHWILKPRNSKLWYHEFFGWLTAHTPAKRRESAALKR